MAEPRELTEEQLELFNELTPIEQGLAIGLLSGLPCAVAYRLADPCNTSSDTVVRAKVSQMKHREKFKAFIYAVQSELLSAALVTREEALEKLSIYARGTLHDLVEYKTVELGKDIKDRPVEQSVWKFKDTASLEPGMMHCISELKSNAQGLSVKIHCPLQALRQMANMRGWNQPHKVDHSSRDGSMTPKEATTLDASQLSDASLHEIIALRDADKDNK